MTRRLPRKSRGRERLLRMLDEKIPAGMPHRALAPMPLGYRMHLDLQFQDGGLRLLRRHR